MNVLFVPSGHSQESASGDHLATVEQPNRHQRPLFIASQLDWSALLANLERPENPIVHSQLSPAARRGYHRRAPALKRSTGRRRRLRLPILSRFVNAGAHRSGRAV
jgi:hypothetical protein